MTHIAIDARVINSSTGRYIERLLHYLEQIDTTNQYTVLVREKDREYWRPTNPNFSVQVAEFDNYSFAEQTDFLKLLNTLDADLVHFCMPQQPIFYRGKHVTTVHDLTLLQTYNSDKNWLAFHAKQLVGRFVFWYIARSSAHIITPTQYTKDAYRQFSGISPDKITVTYESADRHDTTPTPYETLVDQPFIMYVGQQSDYKNIRRLIEAHQQLRQRQPGLKLVLVGSLNASAKQNQAWVEKCGYTDIIFTGFVDDATLAWLYQHCYAYVFPSLMEGFGLPGLEAMAYGAPVASSNASCLPEVYGDGALYFDPHSVDDMARTIEKLLTDDTLRTELIQKGTTQHQRYSWRRMAEQTLEVYRKAL